MEYGVLFVVDFSLIKYIELCEIFDGYFVDSFIDNLIGDFEIYRFSREFYMCFSCVWLPLLPRQKPGEV